MTAPKKAKRSPNPLRGKTATVSLTRNGLTIEIEDVPAAQAATVGGILLQAARQMVRSGFDELVVDAGSIHAAPLGEVPDDAEEEEARHPRRIGFTAS
jgi:hypothetical protein